MKDFEFEEGEKVRLDEGFVNTSIVEVVYQSPRRLFTWVTSDRSTWSVATYRLSRIISDSSRTKPIRELHEHH